MNQTMDSAAYLAAASITKHGWMIQGVAPHVGQTGVSFAYTVGLTTAGLPELTIIGPPIDVSTEILNDAARYSLGATINDGDVLENAASVPLRATTVTDLEPFKVARALYNPITMLQLVWPDPHGSYPGDPGWTLGAWQDVADLPR